MISRLDRDILSTLVSRIWLIFVAPVTLIVIALKVDSVTQGYYYTFTSLMAATVLLELGLAPVLTQYFSHDAAFIVLEKRQLTGTRSLERFASLFRKSCIWYIGLFISVSIVIGAIGSLLMHPPKEILVSWWTFAIMSALTLVLEPFWAIFSALGRISTVQRVKLFGAFWGNLGFWISVYMGQGLSYLFLVPFCLFLCSIVWLTTYRNILVQLLYTRGQEISWWKEVFPLQCQTAISYLGGYLMFQTFTPVLFATHGATIAGQMGMSLSIMNGLTQLGHSVVVSKMPTFGKMIAQKDFDSLRKLWMMTFIIGVGLTSTTSLLFLLILRIIPPHFQERLLPGLLLAILLFVGVLNTIIGSWASYIRSFKVEPYVLASLSSGLATAIANVLIGQMWSSSGQVYSYFLITSFLSIPWFYKITSSRKFHFRRSQV